LEYFLWCLPPVFCSCFAWVLPCWATAILDKERSKEVLEYIDAAIGRREPLSKIIKLLSLFCLADDGFASKTFDQYRRDIIQVNCLCTQQRQL
jgi:hypothetical protein